MRGLSATGNATIEDFVSRRWAAAKAALTKRDSQFVTQIEEEVDTQPTSRLSKEWHDLLESCHEMIFQADILGLNAAKLGPDSAKQGDPVVEAGMESTYHVRSWPAQALALKERVSRVVDTTVTIAGLEKEPGQDIIKEFRGRLDSQFSDIEELRHQYLHARRSWGSGITEDQSWERAVALGFTPDVFLARFFYPAEAELWIAGHWARHIPLTQVHLREVGELLKDLERRLGLV